MSSRFTCFHLPTKCVVSLVIHKQKTRFIDFLHIHIYIDIPGSIRWDIIAVIYLLLISLQVKVAFILRDIHLAQGGCLDTVYYWLLVKENPSMICCSLSELGYLFPVFHYPICYSSVWELFQFQLVIILLNICCPCIC